MRVMNVSVRVGFSSRRLSQFEKLDLFPYGPYSHNLKLEKSVSERIDLGVKDKDGIPVPGGIPIGNQRVNRAVVHDDGQVSFYKAGVRYNDKVSCSEPDNKGICDKANEDVRLYKPDGNFEASVLLVASWYKAGDKTSTHRGVATFQVAIASDFDNTYAVVYYEKGSCTAYNPAFTYMYADYLQEDKLAYQACCKDSSSDGLCEAFYALRPTGDCASETFYSAETESGQLCNATVFAAFGAEENGVRMFVGLDPGNKSSLIIYANGTDYSFQFQNNTDFLVDTEDFQLARDINVLYASFPSGQTLGLLGNNNGKKEDDLVLPDGTMLPNNLTERQIFEQFGQVSQSDSVMRYGPREGPANYTHPDFMPIFLDEQPADVRKGAEAVCGPSNFPCIYDYFATGSSAFALDSKQVKDKADETNVLIRNTVPRIEVPRIVNVTSGIEETFSLQGHDDDNDEITYHVEEDGTGAVQIDSITGLVRFVPDALQPFVARLRADVQMRRERDGVPPCDGVRLRGRVERGAL
nr:hypothetical protein BaRGS_017640 [Batillaria attramentaria]